MCTLASSYWRVHVPHQGMVDIFKFFTETIQSRQKFSAFPVNASLAQRTRWTFSSSTTASTKNTIASIENRDSKKVASWHTLWWSKCSTLGTRKYGPATHPAWWPDIFSDAPYQTKTLRFGRTTKYPRPSYSRQTKSVAATLVKGCRGSHNIS